jgi:hypothetical protein
LASRCEQCISNYNASCDACQMFAVSVLCCASQVGMPFTTRDHDDSATCLVACENQTHVTEGMTRDTEWSNPRPTRMSTRSTSNAASSRALIDI